MGEILKSKGTNLLRAFKNLLIDRLKTVSVVKIFLGFMLMFISSFFSFGQNISNKEIHKIINNKISKVEEFFYSSNCGYLPLVNGKIYNTYYSRIIGHQYFNSNNWEKGFIIIKDKVYTDLLLKYDVFNDKLIYHHISSEGALSIELNKNVIEGFSLAGHNFINVKLDSMNEKYNGYYEILYNGNALLLIKWEKYINKSTDINSSEIAQRKSIYIKNGDKLVKVKNRKSILEALDDKSAEMHEYLKHNKLHIKIASDEELIELMQFYDDL